MIVFMEWMDLLIWNKRDINRWTLPMTLTLDYFRYYFSAWQTSSCQSFVISGGGSHYRGDVRSVGVSAIGFLFRQYCHCRCLTILWYGETMTALMLYKRHICIEWWVNCAEILYTHDIDNHGHSLFEFPWLAWIWRQTDIYSIFPDIGRTDYLYP